MVVRSLLASLASALSAALSLPAPAAPAAAPAPYGMGDFTRVEKIDAHMHLHNADPGFIEAARRLGFKVLTINVDYPDFPPIEVQQRVAVNLRRAYPQDLAFAATFPTDQSDQPQWLAQTQARLDDAFRQGAVGVKVWKNIGMSLRDAAGQLVMVDAPRFAPLFEGLAQRGMPLLGHQGEPYNCWLPLQKMTVRNDREYFKAHPQYHMALHPEMPSWEQQMAARDRMLQAHPRLRFVGMHMASLERDVGELAAFLDRFPTAMVDVAARIPQLQYQSQQDRERVRRFLIEYQDRVLYGSDLAQAPGASGRDMAREAERVWRQHWRYFNTAEVFKVPELDRPVQGLALPRAVVDKLYHANARRAFPGAWPKERP
jgi:predicted TIM-barrel fold metal-dependent hydrolase